VKPLKGPPFRGTHYSPRRKILSRHLLRKISEKIERPLFCSTQKVVKAPRETYKEGNIKTPSLPKGVKGPNFQTPQKEKGRAYFPKKSN